MKRIYAILLVFVIGTLVLACPASAGRHPKLILWGSLYDPSLVLNNVDLLTGFPFSGADFHGMTNDKNGSGYHWVNRSVFAPELIDYNDYTRFIGISQSVLSLSGNPLTDNFLSITTIPGTLSQQVPPDDGQPWTGFTMWNSDFNSVVHNVRVAAKVAKDAGFKGILLDLEPYYGVRIWEYGYQTDKGSLTEPKLWQQVRVRGTRFIQAIEAEFPDIVLLIVPAAYDHSPAIFYGTLEEPFMDGIIAGAGPNMTLIDGQEIFYHTTKSQYQQDYDWVHGGVVNGYVASDVKPKYLSQIQCTFGLWLERNWDCTNPYQYVTTQQWKQRILAAFDVADSEYVWVFNGGTTPLPDFWFRTCLPQVYIDATNDALETIRRPYCGDPNHPLPIGDVNKDCSVDFKDFTLLASRWLIQ